MTTARYIIIGAILLAAYYTLIFGYAIRSRAERSEHVAWRFPMQKGNDLCPDALEDGTVVASDYVNIYFVDRNGKEKARWDTNRDGGVNSSYGGYEGFAWAGGTKDSLLVLSDTMPPMNQSTIMALESDGKVRWTLPVPPNLSANWIIHSPDSIYVLLTELVGSNREIRGTLKRFDLKGKELYSKSGIVGPSELSITKDNTAYVVHASYTKVTAVAPDGTEKWSSSDGGVTALNSRFGGDGTLYCVDNSHLRAFSPTGAKLFALPLSAMSGSGRGVSSPLFSWRELFSLGRGYNSYNFMTAYDLRGRACLADGGECVYWIDDTSLHCISSSGMQQWSKRLPSEPVAVAASRDGVAYVAMTTGGFAAYAPDGREKWRNASIRNITSAMSIGNDGRVYVEADNELICFEP